MSTTLAAAPLAYDTRRSAYPRRHWAMTTMSTVGCGAIIPHSISERAYVICAMILGCGYWGFVLRRVTSIISYKNLSTIAHWARMDDIPGDGLRLGGEPQWRATHLMVDLGLSIPGNLQNFTHCRESRILQGRVFGSQLYLQWPQHTITWANQFQAVYAPHERSIQHSAFGNWRIQNVTNED